MSPFVKTVPPLARRGGLLVLPKGSGLPGELAAAGQAMAILGCEVVVTVPMRPAISETLEVLIVRKVSATPSGYPRRAGVPAKQPL